MRLNYINLNRCSDSELVDLLNMVARHVQVLEKRVGANLLPQSSRESYQRELDETRRSLSVLMDEGVRRELDYMELQA